MNIEKLLVYRISQLILLVGPLTAYIASPWANYDAISLPKMLAISSIGFLVISLVMSQWSILKKRIGKVLLFSSLAFITFLILTLLFSGAPLDQQIWGSFGRNTGLVTYSSLFFLLIGTAIIMEAAFYERLVRVFVLSSIPVVIYCFVQIAGKDPIGWSEKRTFATFGNVNFLSAYLGMVAISCLSLILGKRIPGLIRVISLLILASSIPIISSTGSIQGLMVFSAGAFILSGLVLRSLIKRNYWLIPYGVIGLSLLISVLLALFNRGVLAPYIFQISILLRWDYMHAGLEMTTLKPFFGVGLDSYGDWYRQARGEITTNRGSADRISNSAHNIFLDISSNGGLPLILAYLSVLVLAIFSSIQFFKRSRQFDPIFSAIFATWIGYQVQALISINQIAVGVWGWILTGALIGMSGTIHSNNEDNLSNLEIEREGKSAKEAHYKSMNRKLRTKLLPPQITLLGFLGFSVGAILSIIPLTADMAYKKASQTMAIDQMISATQRIGSTAFHRELVLEAALKANLTAQGGEIALSLIEEHPRDFYAWKILALISPLGSQERVRAVDTLISLDPFNKETIPPKQ